jgi:hypothetical protein
LIPRPTEFVEELRPSLVEIVLQRPNRQISGIAGMGGVLISPFGFGLGCFAVAPRRLVGSRSVAIRPASAPRRARRRSGLSIGWLLRIGPASPFLIAFLRPAGLGASRR